MSYTKRNESQDGTCQETDKVLHSHFVTPVIDFDIVPIQIEVLSRIGVHVSGEFVAVVASRVIREHEDDVGVWDAQSLYGAIPVRFGQWVLAKSSPRCPHIPRALAICYGRELSLW